MPSLMQSLFPCFGGSGDEQQQPGQHEQLSPPSRKPESPRTSSNTSTHATPIPFSEAPGPYKSPIYRPDTDKKLPPKPIGDSHAIELPGSSPDLHEMPATYVPGSHPLARASTATSADLPRPSHQSEQVPQSPYSTHSTLTPGSAAGSTYQPSGSVRAPSERDRDEISPAPTKSYDHPRGGNPNMYSNVADALTDRKRMFERLRKANGVEGQDGEGGGMAAHSTGSPQSSAPPQSMGAVTPVEMWAPVHQPAPAPAELATREHVRSPSEPKEIEG